MSRNRRKSRRGRLIQALLLAAVALTALALASPAVARPSIHTVVYPVALSTTTLIVVVALAAGVAAALVTAAVALGRRGPRQKAASPVEALLGSAGQTTTGRRAAA